MSDYSEVLEEMHEDQIKMEHKADQCKKALIDNLSSAEMIRLMFTGYLNTLSNSNIVKLYDKFIVNDDKMVDEVHSAVEVDIDTLKLKVEMIRHLLRFRFTWDEIYQVFGYSQEIYNDAIKFLKDNRLIDFNTNN